MKTYCQGCCGLEELELLADCNCIGRPRLCPRCLHVDPVIQERIRRAVARRGDGR